MALWSRRVASIHRVSKHFPRVLFVLGCGYLVEKAGPYGMTVVQDVEGALIPRLGGGRLVLEDRLLIKGVEEQIVEFREEELYRNPGLDDVGIDGS